jgi:UDP:flavonoid glycosyltransferase YjiC (YdhE family)
VRLRSYAWTDGELLDAVERLLGPDGPAHRMRPIAERLQAEPGRLKGAALIERLVQTGEPVTSVAA